MGRKPSFTPEDYANRIFRYLHEKQERGEQVSTKDILREVTGTDYRLVDGLWWLTAKKKVRPTLEEMKPTKWTLQ